MSYRIAGIDVHKIDVHKKMLAVVVTDLEVESEYEFARRQFGTTPDHLRWLSEWFVQQGWREVVMESTAQYWKPVWGTLQRYWQPSCKQREGAPHIRNVASGAGAVQSRSGEGAKRDFPDVERLAKRLVANELTLSFVPDAEQRLWRTVTRRRYQQTCDKVRSQNQLEALPEESHLKLSPKFCGVRLTGRASRNGKCRSIYLTFSRFHR